jgi:hypothetical protein
VRRPNIESAARYVSPSDALRIVERRRFALEVRFDKAGRRIEISATVSEALATAFQNAKDLPEEVPSVTTNHIAGAGFEPATFGL